MEEITKQLEAWGLGESTVQMVIDYGLKIIGALIVLYLGFLIGGKVQSAVMHRLEKVNFDASLTKFFGSLSKWGIILLTFLACLSIFGVETTSFAAVIGGASVAIGLALQGSLSHLASGIMLLIFRPFGVGDVITVAGTTGKVDEISLFTVTLDTPDRRRFIIPNGAVFGSTIENVTFHDIRRCDVAVGVGYGDSIDKTREVLIDAMKNVEGVILDDENFPIQAYLTGLGASSVDWQARVFCKTDDYWAVRERLTREVKLKIDEAGLDIPYPQRVIHQA